MKNIAKFVSLIALGCVIVPCLVFFAGRMDLDTVKWLALLGTYGWFLATPLWMGRELPIDAREVEL